MTVEKVEGSANQTNEPLKPAETGKTIARSTTTKTKQEVVALSVKGEAGLGTVRQLPNNRPIEASHLNIVSTYRSLGANRPITASGMEMSGTLAISGNRPISASHLKISETYSVMGNRPVASNEVDDPTALMGYLD